MDFVRDIRHSLRILRKDALFNTTAMLTLTIGIGSTVAVFSIVNTVLLKPMPVFDADHFVFLSTTTPDSEENDGVIPGKI